LVRLFSFFFLPVEAGLKERRGGGIVLLVLPFLSFCLDLAVVIGGWKEGRRNGEAAHPLKRSVVGGSSFIRRGGARRRGGDEVIFFFFFLLKGEREWTPLKHAVLFFSDVVRGGGEGCGERRKGLFLGWCGGCLSSALLVGVIAQRERDEEGHGGGAEGIVLGVSGSGFLIVFGGAGDGGELLRPVGIPCPVRGTKGSGRGRQRVSPFDFSRAFSFYQFRVLAGVQAKRRRGGRGDDASLGGDRVWDGLARWGGGGKKREERARD